MYLNAQITKILNNFYMLDFKLVYEANIIRVNKV